MRDVTATSHVELLVEDAGSAYMAPEAVLPLDGPAEHLDVFSLGAIADHVFAGRPPAANRLELAEKLRASRGLRISDALNGAAPSLQELVQFSTHPDVASRIDSADIPRASTGSASASRPARAASSSSPARGPSNSATAWPWTWGR